MPQVLKRIIEPGDLLCLESDNQKQADFLASQLDRNDLRDIRLVTSCITLPTHIQLFRKGMIRQVDEIVDKLPRRLTICEPTTIPDRTGSTNERILLSTG